MGTTRAVIIANAIIWAAVIAGCAMVLEGTTYLPRLIVILGGGAAGSLVIVGGGLNRIGAARGN